MSGEIYVDSFAALLPEGIIGPQGLRPWDQDQSGPRDVRRDQILDKPYVNFGKLMLADRLAFGAASIALSKSAIIEKETMAIALGIPAGSLSTDLRYIESVQAGFPSPAIFSATLPSSAIADIAIYFGIKGQNRVLAGNGASGLSALEQACMLLKLRKATSVLWCCVTAVDLQDIHNPLLYASLASQCASCAIVLSSRPRENATGIRISTSFQTASASSVVSGDELYFNELFQLLINQKTGSLHCASCDVVATLSLEKDG
jgi:hypothetical protein